ncbi:hypothetical protein C5C36_12865 [Rathayibacter sp. AY1G1]|jgi:hypothetical protein|uniref:hypothetical protein n=1 Tax=unclassified Rathayibacter TaxID=2609250 RepID=UPI000CE7933E|nr:MULTISPECIES: hypothetical protein [unclassified Rathayibacter]PPF10308.1 hypothetical protein C5B98_12660 [Rathayibacter sp. AY1A5]PPF18738.1 hypothetical protein C5B95_11175 [Rathayibacter sp. AY1A7]PPF26763.1 hypothetical protein C5C54_12135 [Rathayibacter sp. AY1F2]PPF35072.1 hypothetical protein C5B93_11630 [Rathayibacter sp. AY1A2]PPF35191.1 hypothetical protein C5C10_08335 [Rathayibacter sp. AY1A3]
MTDTARATGLPTLTPVRTLRKEQPIEPRRVPDSVSVGSQPVIGCRIDVSGRSFVVELDMAGIFLRQVRRSLREGEGGLVLLRHVDGIEMIPFSRATPFDVSDIVCPEGVEPADARSALGLRDR